jgi:uncharacterized protein (UPF0548 family)
MMLFRQPDDARTAAFLAAHASRPYSYAETGASRTSPPPGYAVDHHRVLLGHGPASFRAACAALRGWQMFRLAWVALRPKVNDDDQSSKKISSFTFAEPPVAEGQVLAVIARVAGVWFLNACRIVYVWQDAGAVDRFGFAYGTLAAHMARGEERFSVEWHHADDSVWYDLLAFSRPRHVLFRLGYPLARWVQHRFARDCGTAMARAVAGAVDDRPPGVGEVQVVCRRTPPAEVARWLGYWGAIVGLLGGALGQLL